MNTRATETHPSFPGKVILAGEHFVLYGVPAIAVPWHGGGLCLVPREAESPQDIALEAAWAKARVLCGLAPIGVPDFSVRSSIPAGAGLGSSAALSMALVHRACLQAGERPDAVELGGRAARVEDVFHGVSSGLDPMVIALDAPLHWTGPHKFERISWGLCGPVLIVAMDPLPRVTAEAVARVRNSADLRPRWFRARAQAMARIVARVRSAIESGDILELGTSLTAAHAILAELGVSSPRLDAIVSAAIHAGALGAKLTGAGIGGAVIAVCEPRRSEAVQAAMASAGAVILSRAEWSPHR